MSAAATDRERQLARAINRLLALSINSAAAKHAHATLVELGLDTVAEHDAKEQLKAEIGFVIDHALPLSLIKSEPETWLAVPRSVVVGLYELTRSRPGEKIAPWHEPGCAPGRYSCRVRGSYCNTPSCAPMPEGKP